VGPTAVDDLHQVLMLHSIAALAGTNNNDIIV
jgi:hypothetical protein